MAPVQASQLHIAIFLFGLLISSRLQARLPRDLVSPVLMRPFPLLQSSGQGADSGLAEMKRNISLQAIQRLALKHTTREGIVSLAISSFWM
jgi:hypothetical protein